MEEVDNQPEFVPAPEAVKGGETAQGIETAQGGETVQGALHPMHKRTIRHQPFAGLLMPLA
jgi:hypothetical protein